MRQAIPFGKYLLLDRISVGGMAEVFKAKSYGVEGFEKVIAIKRILPSMGEDREFIKMFIDEAKIVGQLAHANICQIFELGRTDGAHFIAMEYIWGKDLLQIQNRARKLKQQIPVSMACFVVAKVLEGLDYAHKKRDALGRPLEIVHRDCSPQNVLMSYEGEVKIIDFGIAKAASRSSKTQAGVLKGKFGYMSPEQVRGLPLDRRSDIFSVGTILYECLSGDRLFVGETDFSTLEKVRNVDIPRPREVNPAIPEAVEAIIMKALAKDAADRYQWASEMVGDLQRYLMSQDAVFTAKTLSSWLKDGFAPEIERERAQHESFKKLGREGLIANVPMAEAKLDVVEHLGEAGKADDPTMLGGPSFDDILPDSAGPAPGSPAARGAGPDEFAEEGPTEIFGEISEVGEAPAPVAAPAPAVVLAPNARRPPTINGPAAGPPAAPPPPPPSHAEDPTISPLGMMAPPLPVAPPAPMPLPMAPPPGGGGANAKTMLGVQAPVIPPPGSPVYTPAQGYPPPGAPPTPYAPPATPEAGPPAGYPGGPAGYPGGPAGYPGGPAGYPGGPAGYPGGAPGYGGYGAPPQPYGGPPSGPPSGPPPGYGAPYPYQGPPVAASPSYPSANIPAASGPTAAVDSTARRKKKPSLGKDIAIGVAIAALVLGAAAAVKFTVLDKPAAKPAPAAAATARLDIAVTDAGGGTGPATVSINGAARGQTSDGKLAVADLAPGSYAVRIEREGAAPCETTIELAAGAAMPVACELKPAAAVPPVTDAGVAVEDAAVPEVDAAAVVDAAAPIDAALVAVADPPDDAPPDPGPGSDKAKPDDKPGDKPGAGSGKKPGGGSGSAKPGSDKPGGGSGSAKPGSDKPGGAIAIGPGSGSAKPGSGSGSAKPGSGSGSAKPGDKPGSGSGSAKPGDKPGAGSGAAKPGGDKPGSGSATPTGGEGYLVAFTTPFAAVTVDGVPRGTTPITVKQKIALSPGLHKVQFKVGNETWRYTVKIESGKTTTLSKDLPVSQ